MADQFQNPIQYATEFIGTLILIAIGCTVGGYGVAMGGNLLIAFGFAATFVGLIYCIGKASDCHFNPLVTLSMFINGRMNAQDTAFYIVAQILGGIVGAFIALVLLGQSELLGIFKNLVYPSYYGTDLNYYAGIGVLGAFILEMFFAFILCYIALKATQDRKIDIKSGAIIAFAMFGLIYFGCMTTKTAVNPAKSIGTALAMMFSGIDDRFDFAIQLWLFIIAPIIGALIASFLYMIVESGSFDVNKFVEDIKAKKEEKAAQKAAEAEAKAAAEAEAAEAEESAEEEPVEEVSEEETVEEVVISSDDPVPEIESIEEEKKE